MTTGNPFYYPQYEQYHRPWYEEDYYLHPKARFTVTKYVRPIASVASTVEPLAHGLLAAAIIGHTGYQLASAYKEEALRKRQAVERMKEEDKKIQLAEMNREMMAERMERGLSFMEREAINAEKRAKDLQLIMQSSDVGRGAVADQFMKQNDRIETLLRDTRNILMDVSTSIESGVGASQHTVKMLDSVTAELNNINKLIDSQNMLLSGISRSPIMRGELKNIIGEQKAITHELQEEEAELISPRSPRPPPQTAKIMDINMPKFDVKVPPTIYKSLQKGRTVEINKSAKAIINQISEHGIDSILNNERWMQEPAYSLFTQQGFQDAILDPDKFIPTSLYQLGGPNFENMYKSRMKTIKKLTDTQREDIKKRYTTTAEYNPVADIILSREDIFSRAGKIMQDDPSITPQQAMLDAERELLSELRKK